MKAVDRLKNAFGANIAESIGAQRSTVDQAGSAYPGGPPVHGGPTPPSANRYGGASRLKDALAIELDRIEPDPDQPRKHFDEPALNELAASLRTRGQLQPIRVRWHESSGKWRIVSGERRWRAARLAGLAVIVAIEAKAEMSPDEVLEDQLVENLVRADLQPIEEARAYRALLDYRGCSLRDLAESLNISHQTVMRALALLELPDDLQAKVDTGALPASAAATIARVEDDAERRDLAERVEAGALTREDVAEVVRRKAAKSANKGKGRGVPKARTKPVVHGGPRRASNGVKVRIEATLKHELADVVAALRELADRLAAEVETAGSEAA
ncbi:MAG: ParB/RepB/Spo0J family partition protein [Alphaproteobacteria bacterium]|nr:ParB/RepB/Spo0J family partition protein [Alphaproteobacteria bacterium]